MLMRIAPRTVLAIGTYLSLVPDPPPGEIYLQSLERSNPVIQVTPSGSPLSAALSLPLLGIAGIGHSVHVNALQISSDPHDMESDVTSGSPTGQVNTASHKPVSGLGRDGHRHPTRQES